MLSVFRVIFTGSPIVKCALSRAYWLILALFGWRCLYQHTVIRSVYWGRHGRINVEILFCPRSSWQGFLLHVTALRIKNDFLHCALQVVFLYLRIKNLGWSVFNSLLVSCFNQSMCLVTGGCLYNRQCYWSWWARVWIYSMTAWTLAHSRLLAFIKRREKSICTSAGLMTLALWMILSCVIVQSADRRLTHSVLLVLEAVGHVQLCAMLFSLLIFLPSGSLRSCRGPKLGFVPMFWSGIHFHFNYVFQNRQKLIVNKRTLRHII